LNFFRLQVCGGDDESNFLLCEGCLKGWHIQCLVPRLDTVPYEGWFCPSCSSQQKGSRVPVLDGSLSTGEDHVQFEDAAHVGDSAMEASLKRQRSKMQVPDYKELELQGRSLKKSKTQADEAPAKGYVQPQIAIQTDLPDRYKGLLHRLFSPDFSKLKFMSIEEGRVLRNQDRLQCPCSLHIMLQTYGRDNQPIIGLDDLRLISPYLSVRCSQDNLGRDRCEALEIKEDEGLEQNMNFSDLG
jgi:hypothetical protein